MHFNRGNSNLVAVYLFSNLGSSLFDAYVQDLEVQYLGGSPAGGDSALVIMRGTRISSLNFPQGYDRVEHAYNSAKSCRN